MHPLLRTREEYVQTAPAYIGIYWPKTLINLPTMFSRSIGKGNKDHIALVTLHVLKVFNEKRLFHGIQTIDNTIDFRPTATQFINSTFDLVALF